jgi:hypothetical protein
LSQRKGKEIIMAFNMFNQTIQQWQICRRDVVRFERKEHDNKTLTLSEGVGTA